MKQEGGILEQMLREVEIECLPGDIPSHIDVDVTELTFGKVIRVVATIVPLRWRPPSIRRWPPRSSANAV